MGSALLITHVKRMLDGARGLILAEIEHQENDRATAALYCSSFSHVRLSVRPETHNHGCQRRSAERGARPACPCLDGLQHISALGVIADRHLVDEAG